MAEPTLDALIERVLSDPACSIKPATQPVALPESLPDDVRQFFARCVSGGLYYEMDYATPQFGCELGYSSEQPVNQCLPCEGEEFESFYVIGNFTDMGESDCAVVSVHPDTFGQIYRLNFSMGDPELTLADAHYLAPSFTRWLAVHVEAWDVYQQDWREGLTHFSRLLEQEDVRRRSS